jgi:hypothetical protein
VRERSVADRDSSAFFAVDGKKFGPRFFGALAVKSSTLPSERWRSGDERKKEL